jgi:hypothetical protein
MTAFSPRALLVFSGMTAVLLGQHPHPQPRPTPSQVTISADGGTTTVITGNSIFPPCSPASDCDPFLHPPGTNFLPTIYTNAFDGNGKMIENTLPSTPTVPYNLHDEPVVSTLRDVKLSPTSPQDDLHAFFEAIQTNVARLISGQGNAASAQRAIQTAIQGGLDVLEGNTNNRGLQNRAYKGLPLLHYRAHEKVKAVDPKTRNVDIHQVWYDTHIESDTAFLNVEAVQEVPWTITYTVDVLNRGHDDFSPFVMYVDDPSLSPKPMLPGMAVMGMPLVAMDQTYFNMEDGTRTIFKIKMAPAKYYNLTYTWGWRAHPPRVQATENASKTVAMRFGDQMVAKALVDWEKYAFYKPANPDRPDPSSPGTFDKDYAIGQISRYAPAKRMWTALRDGRDALQAKDYKKIEEMFRTSLKAGQPGIAQQAWRDWRDRTRLPRGLPKDVVVDKDSDLTLLYVNNTIYGEFSDGGRMDFPKWTVRGTQLKVTLYNGDYFNHGYQNVDFGGARGWENQFKSSVKVAGSGCWFTFGRVHWWMNIPPAQPLMEKMGIPGVVTVPKATRATAAGGDDRFGVHRVSILYNYEPSRRVRFYQFDPVHHDVAVFSVH